MVSESLIGALGASTSDASSFDVCASTRGTLSIEEDDSMAIEGSMEEWMCEQLREQVEERSVQSSSREQSDARLNLEVHRRSNVKLNRVSNVRSDEQWEMRSNEQ